MIDVLTTPPTLPPQVTLIPDAPNPLGILSSKATGEPSYALGASAYFSAKYAIRSARTDAGVTGGWVEGRVGAGVALFVPCATGSPWPLPCLTLPVNPLVCVVLSAADFYLPSPATPCAIATACCTTTAMYTL